jgi:hypothetical protein
MKLFQEWGRRRNKEEWWGRVYSIMIYLINCKNICKCHSVPLPRTTMIKQ